MDGVLVIPRPAELSRPESTSYSAVMHALAESERRLRRRFDAVALLQCTSPFTLPEDVDGAIDLLDRAGAGSVFSVCRLDHAYHPAKVRVLDGDRLLPYEGDTEPRAAHEVSTLWVNNGSIYLSRRETLEAGIAGLRRPLRLSDARRAINRRQHRPRPRIRALPRRARRRTLAG